MRLWRNVLVAVTILALVGVAQAQQAGKRQKKGNNAERVRPLAGLVAGVNAEKNEITVKTRAKGKEPKSVTVTVAKDVQITVDGKAAKLGDLKEGFRVRVTPATGSATKIAAKTPRQPKAPNAKREDRKREGKKVAK